MFLSRSRYDELLLKAGRLTQMSEEVVRLQKEVRRLTDVVIRMKQEGFDSKPEHLEEPWPDGRYVMDEVIKPTPAQTEEAAEVEAILRRDLDRVFSED